jgi:hypothetical protein
MHIGTRGGADDVKHARSLYARHSILAKDERVFFAGKGQESTLFYDMTGVLAR